MAATDWDAVFEALWSSYLLIWEQEILLVGWLYCLYLCALRITLLPGSLTNTRALMDETVQLELIMNIQ